MSSDPRVPEDGSASHAAEGQGVRKPYVRPDFIREEVFETTALACGKINPTIRQCNLVRKNS
jgi:hypothetical protein